MRSIYAISLYADPDGTLDDLREAATTLEDIEKIARRVFGRSHPQTLRYEQDLRLVRKKLVLAALGISS